MEFLRPEHWSGLPLPSPGDLPNPRIEPTSPALAGGFFTTEPLRKPTKLDHLVKKKNSYSFFKSRIFDCFQWVGNIQISKYLV